MIDLRLTILLVDNQRLFLDARAERLEHAGYRVLTANTAAEARQFLETYEIDVALLDVRLEDEHDPADISGLLLAPEIGLYAPVIIYSDYLKNADLWRRTLTYKIDSVIAKHEAMETLITEIKRLIDNAPILPANTGIDTNVPPVATPPPEALIQASSDNDLILYAGDQLGVAAGAPSRRTIAKDLLRLLRGRPDVNQDAVRAWSRDWWDGKVETTLDDVFAAMLRSEAGSRLLTEYFNLRFPPESAISTGVQAALLDLPLAGIVSTDLSRIWDATSEPGEVFSATSYDKLAHLLPRRERFLLKLGGLPDLPDTIRLVPRQWRNLLQADPQLHDLIRLIFYSRNILFVGYKLHDLAALLDALMLDKPARQHFALTPIGEPGWEAKAEDLQRWYNIQVLPFSDTGDESDAIEFIRQVQVGVDKMRSSLQGQSVHPPGERTHKLKRVKLENIGLFETLELALSRDVQWNVLLGDNGSGKSTVLKAVAFALAGREATPYAERLLRVGANSGCIELEFADGELIRVEISRTAGKEVREITSFSLRSEQWLAIAFPPLRPINWQAPRLGEIVEPPHSTMIDRDLLPLLESPLDHRIDDVKQLLLTLHVQLQSRTEATPGDSRAQTPLQRRKPLFETLFETYNLIGEGVPLRFSHIDDKLMPHVFIGDLDSAPTPQPDPKPVPLPMLSQGIGALLGWIGLLLKRLYDVYDQSSDPRQESALVIIDEIDAHMHPKWQRKIVKHLSEIFPNVQFIAATHSPLIIGSLTQQEVFRLDACGEVSSPPEDLVGMGAAGILRSVFELPSTLDVETEQKLARQRELAARTAADLTESDLAELRELDHELAGLGFQYEFRDPLYSDFRRIYAEEKRKRRAAVQNAPGVTDQKQTHLVREAVNRLLDPKKGRPTR